MSLGAPKPAKVLGTTAATTTTVVPLPAPGVVAPAVAPSFNYVTATPSMISMTAPATEVVSPRMLEYVPAAPAIEVVNPMQAFGASPREAGSVTMATTLNSGASYPATLTQPMVTFMVSPQEALPLGVSPQEAAPAPNVMPSAPSAASMYAPVDGGSIFFQSGTASTITTKKREPRKRATVKKSKVGCC
mmetsp:Transcript_30968/g.57999  ORF Transcript_30968/g.57999 Transcript_30968/m.57999 type:complete len:189 (-) Transcript_30968:29-595(-)